MLPSSFIFWAFIFCSQMSESRASVSFFFFFWHPSLSLQLDSNVPNVLLPSNQLDSHLFLDE